jgi:hypothetical protein
MPRRRMNQMRNALRHVVMPAALLAGLAVTGGSRAHAGVSFSGTFPLPHGQISIGIGDPYFHVGAFVPVGYQIYARSGYGYGFAYNNRWIPVRPYGDGWRVCGSPYFDDVYYHRVYYDPYYGAGYGGYYGGHYMRPSRHYAYRGGHPRGHAHHDYAPRYHQGHNWNGHRNEGGHDHRGDGRIRGHGHGGKRHGEGHRR